EPQAVGRSLFVLEAQGLRRGPFLVGDAAAQVALLEGDRRELGFEGAAARGEREERPMRLAQRTRVGAQLARGLAARLLGAREVALQLADARAQVAQLRFGCVRSGAGRERRAEEAAQCGGGEPAQRPPRPHRAQRALPWLATDCIACVIACWSPR